MDTLLQHSRIGPQLERLSCVWAFPEEYKYYVALGCLFPGCFKETFEVCPEFGPMMYKHKINNSKILVLRQVRENNVVWSCVLSTDWMNTHRKLTPPIWLDDYSIQKKYTRLSRNELLFENWKTTCK